MQTTIITVTIVEVVIDNTLSIVVNQPGQPLWAAGGLYDPAMMDAYWADIGCPIKRPGSGKQDQGLKALTSQNELLGRAAAVIRSNRFA